jgi:hypothetical protein
MSMNPTATPTQIAELLCDLFAVGAGIPDGLRLVAQQEAAFALALAPAPEALVDIEDEVDGMVDPTDRWDNNEVQFARLLHELFDANAVTHHGLRLAADAMDLHVEDVYALLERATAVWDAARASVPVGGDPDEEDTSDPDSTAPDRWTCWDASGVRVSYTDVTAEVAAYAYVFRGDYVHPVLGEWTSFIEVQVAETADGPDARGETIHVPLYPGSPPCWDGLDAIDPDYVPDDDGHKWSRVSTTGDGAGVYVTEVCGWCGLLKDTRTRPQCPDCGETLSTEAIRYRREEE